MRALRRSLEIRPASTRNLRLLAAFSASPVLIISRMRVASALSSSRSLVSAAFEASSTMLPIAVTTAAPTATTIVVNHRVRCLCSRLRSSCSACHFSRSNSGDDCSDMNLTSTLVSIEFRASPCRRRSRCPTTGRMGGSRLTSRLKSTIARCAASFDHLVGAGEQRQRHGKAEDFCGLEVDDQLETSSSAMGGAPIADIVRAIRYAVAASGCSTLAETDLGGTFSNRGPNPSAMVGCVRIASRSV